MMVLPSCAGVADLNLESGMIAGHGIIKETPCSGITDRNKYNGCEGTAPPSFQTPPFLPCPLAVVHPKLAPVRQIWGVV